MIVGDDSIAAVVSQHEPRREGVLMSQEARSYDKMDVGDDMMIIMSFCVCVELEFLAVNNSTLIVHLLGKILSWFVLIAFVRLTCSHDFLIFVLRKFVRDKGIMEGY